jgi:ankyrin repeat protein
MSQSASQKFFNACSTGKSKLVCDFLAAGVDPESRDSYRLTGLIWAGRKGHIGVAKALLLHGAKLETGDVRHRTALFHAVTYKRYDFVKFIAGQGADLSPVDTHGWTPLDVSVSSCHKKMVDLLTSLGAKSARNSA